MFVCSLKVMPKPCEKYRVLPGFSLSLITGQSAICPASESRLQMMVPRYLEVSIDSLTREQEKFRGQIAQTFGLGGFGAIEEQVRRNMEMFERTFSMFAPFARQGQTDKTEGDKPAGTGDKPAGGGEEFTDLKRQMEEMQKRLDKLSDKDK